MISDTSSLIKSRDTEIWLKDNERYAIIMMYSVNDGSEPRFVRAGPMYADTVKSKINKMIDDAENGKFVSLNSQFIRAENVISIKVDKWKDNNDRKGNGDFDY